jgi:hypothetical protein
MKVFRCVSEACFVRLVYVKTFAVVSGGLFVVLTAVIAVVTKQNEEPV